MLDTKKVRALAKANNITSAYQLWKALKLAGHQTSESQVGRLWTGEPDPKQSTMDMLCEALKCEQSQIIKRLAKRTKPQAAETNGRVRKAKKAGRK